ncbi:MAG TPA: COX15/CtaA family protein [Rhodocyclaceae bacterium]|nr:COX15/CtaA family protein [Rhodocyclaceae bacterium]
MADGLTIRSGFGDLYRPLLAASTALTICVIGLGAYVRLTDAGLGCPDWPGCYGHLVVPEHAADVGRAWREMIHRYAAGSLGLLIICLTGAAWLRNARRLAPPWPAIGLSGLVVVQALLGMWTVTELLRPIVVTAHLLGGMLLWTLLVALCRIEFGTAAQAKVTPLGVVALAAAMVQVALGGWVSSHYAGLACPDFPACPGGWIPDDTPAGIQWLHRLGALVAVAAVSSYAAVLIRSAATRRLGIAIAAALGVQLTLGIANVLLRLPLPLAVAHNLGAAALLATLAWATAGKAG